MNTRVQRYYDRNTMRNRVEDLQMQGFDLVYESDIYAELKKISWGTAGMHFIWFLFTFWWSFGVGNLVYGLYAYYNNSQKVILKLNQNL